MDVVSLLIEAGRTSVAEVLSTETGIVIVDNREFPLTRYEEAADLSVATRECLGGVLDLRRPRESGPFPVGDPGWDFASLTFGGAGEVVIALLAERGFAEEWSTLNRIRPRSDFVPLSEVRSGLRE